MRVWSSAKRSAYSIATRSAPLYSGLVAQASMSS
jgi:hypothetical protein